MSSVEPTISKPGARRRTQGWERDVQGGGQALPGSEHWAVAPVRGPRESSEHPTPAGWSNRNTRADEDHNAGYLLPHGVQRDILSLPALQEQQMYQRGPPMASLTTAVAQADIFSQLRPNPTPPTFRQAVQSYPQQPHMVIGIAPHPATSTSNAGSNPNILPLAGVNSTASDLTTQLGMVRCTPQIVYNPELLGRISAAEERIRYSPHLLGVKHELRKKMDDAVAATDAYGRIPRLTNEAGLSKDISIGSFSMEGYPANDDDIQYIFEDVTSISRGRCDLLKNTLLSHLTSVRQHARECVMELERVLAEQIPFRPIPQYEIDSRRAYIVGRFITARQEIINKFQNYLGNVKLIDSSDSTQRRGSLSNRQKLLLRLWLFSNFSSPYPSGSDKKKLIAETKMTKGQIDNWFINARARVWKPTVSIMSGERARKNAQQPCAAGESPNNAVMNSDGSTFGNGDQHPSRYFGAHNTVFAGTHLDSKPTSGQPEAVQNDNGISQTPAGVGTHHGGGRSSRNWLPAPNWISLDFPADAKLNGQFHA